MKQFLIILIAIVVFFGGMAGGVLLVYSNLQANDDKTAATDIGIIPIT